MNKKILILLAVAVGILIAGVIVFLYWPGKESTPLEEQGAVETAKTVSESVPEIQTNPGENVPEINPLDRANPFKYKNPLR